MTTATAKRTKKRKPRTKAKPCKKATLRDQRVKRARAKTSCAVTASLVIAMLNETERCLRFEQKKVIEQADRVRRWAYACLNDKDLELGAESLRQASKAVHGVHGALGAYISNRGPKGIGHYAIAWIALGFVVDETRHKFIGTPSIRRNWNFFSSTTNTFAEMFLAQAEEDLDYEALAGEAAEHVWSSFFEMPKGSWIRL